MRNSLRNYQTNKKKTDKTNLRMQTKKMKTKCQLNKKIQTAKTDNYSKRSKFKTLNSQCSRRERKTNINRLKKNKPKTERLTKEPTAGKTTSFRTITFSTISLWMKSKIWARENKMMKDKAKAKKVLESQSILLKRNSWTRS